MKQNIGSSSTHPNESLFYINDQVVIDYFFQGDIFGYYYKFSQNQNYYPTNNDNLTQELFVSQNLDDGTLVFILFQLIIILIFYILSIVLSN